MGGQRVELSGFAPTVGRPRPATLGGREGAGLASRVVASFPSSAGAYVHVPFCEQICPFCPYNKVLVEADLARRYFDALHREIGLYVDQLTGPLTSLYIGGGTPTLFPERLSEIVDAIPVTGERAVEVFPTHATADGLQQLAEAGIDYLSIGAQSFDDGVLGHLRRPHTAADNVAALDHALGRFDCVDVDLIFDVAYESSHTFLDDVRYCFERGVDQISTYPLMRFGYTPFGKARHDRRTEHRLLHRVEEMAVDHGYERRSVWTFNKATSSAYTSITREFVLGMGAGSATFTGRDFYVNHFGVRTYLDRVASGALPVARRLHLGPVAGAVYYLFWQAYAGRVDPQRLRTCFGPLTATAARVGLTAATLTPLLRREDHTFVLTPRGFDVYHDLERWATYNFIEPLWAEMMQEHLIEGTHRRSGRAPGAGWIQPEGTHTGPFWHLAKRAFEH